MERFSQSTVGTMVGVAMLRFAGTKKKMTEQVTEAESLIIWSFERMPSEYSTLRETIRSGVP